MQVNKVEKKTEEEEHPTPYVLPHYSLLPIGVGYYLSMRCLLACDLGLYCFTRTGRYAQPGGVGLCKSH